MTRFPSRRLAVALATILAAGSLAACAAAPPQVHVYTDKADPRGQMVITGNATMQVSPDCADLSMTLASRSMRPGEAVKEVQAQQAALIAALRKLGVADGELKLSTLGIQPEYEYVLSQNVFKGYNARITITVTTRKFDQIGPLMEAGADVGVKEMVSQFRRSDLDVLKKKVREMALLAAKDKAQQTATTLGIELGPIAEVKEESASYLYSNAYFPSNAQTSMNESGGALGAEMQPLTLAVTVTYRLPEAGRGV